ncbi:unnamed protein product [Parnassius apollo]|uniref:(apollo) hypothetical protein n=1 Tax=Parnassius apollo TaxID=110799 RepID=A0A8S3YFQ9_PARAO|nr:unnamed protein product [Parnassius apollo]
MHRLFTELEPSITVTEQNLADRVRYILRSNIFDVAELERLRREAVPSSNENAKAGGTAPQVAEQPAHVDAAVNAPVVADSNDDGTVTQELEIEQMRSTLEEAIMETRSTPLENRPRLPRIALSKRNRAVVRALNPMLVTYLEASRDLCETDSILFGAALAVCRIIGAKLSTAGRTTEQSSAIPAWRTRIEERIAKARALIGRLICFRSGNTRPRIVRTIRMAFAGTNVSLSQPDIMQKLTERIDDLKQRIAAWGKRIRRYTERSTRFNQNRLFQSDQKRLYKSLERPMIGITDNEEPDTESLDLNAENHTTNENENLHREKIIAIDEMFAKALEYFANTNPTERQFIPKQRSSKKLSKIVAYVNNILLPQYINSEIEFKTFQNLVYCAAWTSAKLNGAKIEIAIQVDNPLGPEKQKKYNKPKWEQRLKNKVSELRAKIARLTQYINGNRACKNFRAKGEETECLAYRARMHRFFAEVEPSLSVTEQNLADRVRYILRSNIFGDAELERLRRAAIRSSNGNATAGNAAPLDAQQTAYVDAAVNIPFVANSDGDGIVSHELEKMRSILEESMLETRSMPLENRPRLPRIPLSKRNRAVVRALKPMLVSYLEASRDFCETDSILFGAALVVCRIIGAKLPVAGRATQKSSAISAWRKRIEDRIAKARALIGRLTSFRSGNNRPRVVRTVRMAFAGTNFSLSQPDITQKLTERIDDLK